MRAFKISLNGKRVCVAGAGTDDVVTIHIDYIGRGRKRGGILLAATGLFTASDEHAIWTNRSLKVGDRIRVDVVEVDSADKPRQRYKSDSATYRKNQKAYIRAWAKEFGWRIVAGRSKSK